jgi:uncharacterized protein (TIGR02145 family)
MKKRILVVLFALALSANLRAQVTIGALTAPKAGALLDLNSTTTGGLVLSNVDLPDLSVIPGGVFVGIFATQDTNPELAGMIVYNTNTTTGIGVHVWDGNDWIRPCAPSAPGPITLTGIENCTNSVFTASIGNVNGATSYDWTLPTGMEIVGASNGTTIRIKGTSVGNYLAGSITVRAVNSCGGGTRRASTQAMTIDALPAFNVDLTGKVEFINTDTTVSRNGRIFSAPVKITASKTTFDGGSSAPYNADYRNHQVSSSDPTDDTGDYGSWFSWCMVAQYADVLCPSPWRVPTAGDFCKYANDDENNSNTNSAIKGGTHESPGVDGWLFSGHAIGSSTFDQRSYGNYWASTDDGSTDYGHRANVNSSYFSPVMSGARNRGMSLRCVKTAP